MLVYEPLGIFWDMENCRVPRNIDLFELIPLIRRSVQNFGTITLFQGYIGEQPKWLKIDALEKKLHSVGFVLKNCPHAGRKNVVDDEIILDIKRFISKNTPLAATCIIVLISGDGDFITVLQRMQDLGHIIVVFSIEGSSSARLRELAHHSANWSPLCEKALVSAKPTIGKRKLDELSEDENHHDIKRHRHDDNSGDSSDSEESDEDSCSASENNTSDGLESDT